MIENVPASLELHLELRDRQRPRTQRLHEPALEIKEPQKPPGVFLHRELATQRAVITREPEWITRLALQRRFVLTSDADGGNDGMAAIGSGIVRDIHGADGSEQKDAPNSLPAQVLLGNALRTKFTSRGAEP